MSSIKRREFITLLGGACAWLLAAGAQQPGMPVIGLLLVAYAQTDREGQARIAAFLDTFQKLGWTDGRNVRIEYRWRAGDIDREKAFAAELVRSAPDVIVAVAPTTLAELHRLTSTIPIVFTQVSDPVGSGFVAGLARPGGNITGFQNFEPAMGGKWLGLLKEAAPNMTRAAVLFGSDAPPKNEQAVQACKAATRDARKPSQCGSTCPAGRLIACEDRGGRARRYWTGEDRNLRYYDLARTANLPAPPPPACAVLCDQDVYGIEIN